MPNNNMNKINSINTTNSSNNNTINSINSIEEKQAVDTMVSAITSAIRTSASASSHDLTFPSIVTTIDSIGGLFTIKDESGADRLITCSIPNYKPSIGQKVWVKIPCGKLKDMHICGIR